MSLTEVILAGNVLKFVFRVYSYILSKDIETYIFKHLLSLASHVQFSQINTSFYGPEYLWEWAAIKNCLQRVYNIVSVDSYCMRKLYPHCICAYYSFSFFVKYLSSLVKLPEGVGMSGGWMFYELISHWSLHALLHLHKCVLFIMFSGLNVMCLPSFLKNGHREWLSWQQWAKLAFIMYNVYCCTCFLL